MALERRGVVRRSRWVREGLFAGAFPAAAYPHFDAAMFPIDPRLGKDYMRGAQQFIDAIEVDHFIPMHFGEHYAKANAFAPYAHHHFFPLHQRGQTMTLFE